MSAFSGGTCSFVLVLSTLSLPARAQCGDEVVLQYLAAGPSAPVLRTPKGAPVIGGDFAFQLRGGKPLALGALVYSAFENPVFDPQLGAIVWPGTPFFAKFFATNALGNSTLQFNTPVVPDDLCGVQATFQGVVFDASLPGGLTVSNAVRMRAGSVSEPLFPAHATLATSGPETTGDTAVGDLDEDGLRDLVSVSATEPALWVRLGQIGGGFALPQASALAQLSRSVDLVDIDGDTHLDVVRTIVTGVAVSLGDGLGGFLSHASFPGVASGPVAAAVADFDEDGELDVVLANNPGSFVTVLLGDGLGAFGAPTTFLAASGVNDVEAGDLDGDGHQDLVAAARSGNRIAVLEGFGDGTFASPVTYAHSSPRSLELLDLDGDSVFDVAVALGGTDRVAVRFGNGDLTLGAATLYETGNEPHLLAAADVDGDTVADLLAYCKLTQDVSVLLGVGDGTFTHGAGIGTFGSASAIEPTDVDLDGTLDLLVSVPSGIRTVLGVGDGTFRATQRLPLGRDLLAIGDLDRDGENDIVASRGSTEIVVLLHQEDGSFLETDSFPASTSAFSGLEIADLNGDGNPDIVVAAGGAAHVHLGNGDGTLVLLPNAIPPAVSSGGKFVLADFDGDQVLDFAGRAAQFVQVALGNGDGTFVLSASLYGGPAGGLLPIDFAAGDMNGDSFADLVFVQVTEFTSITSAVVRLSNGDGTFGATLGVVPNTTSNLLVFVEVADPNRDGDLDVLVRIDGSVRYYQNDGVGTFTLAQSIVADTTGLQVADLEGEGRTDLVMLDFATSDDGAVQAQVFPWLDTDQFGTPVRYTVGADAVGFVLADLDVDGILDIAAVDHSIPGGRLSILYNQVGE